jgi:hypothetical protein
MRCQWPRLAEVTSLERTVVGTLRREAQEEQLSFVGLCARSEQRRWTRRSKGPRRSGERAVADVHQSGMKQRNCLHDFSQRQQSTCTSGLRVWSVAGP